VWHSCAVFRRRRRLVLWAVGILAVLGVVALGLSQAGKDTAAPPKAATISRAEIAERLRGAPPALAALHRQTNEILPGGRAALRKRLAQLRGHPAVVNIWAAWCGPCRAEMPVMQQVALDMGKRVAFLGVDLRDNREEATRFLRGIPVPYPSYADPSGQVYNAEKLVGVPSTLFYDRRGRQTFVHQGPYYERADLVDDIRRYALR
jgi:cytochrome c biogenesis protein CcmG, thiol:disulfide interchange protein DsbE